MQALERDVAGSDLLYLAKGQMTFHWTCCRDVNMKIGVLFFLFEWVHRASCLQALSLSQTELTDASEVVCF